MTIGVIGTGYVGLVTGACFAEKGNKVICVDVDENKINNLINGKIPIYEPGLEEIVKRNFACERLIFTTSLAKYIDEMDVVFSAVGTPSDINGSADLKYVLAVARQFGSLVNKRTLFVTKSTVPVGTAKKIRDVVTTELTLRGFPAFNDIVNVASNPEFLKEGSAVHDFLHPSAEMIKYASNSMLATRISFMNEIANLCERVGANVDDVRKGMGSDTRIGNKFLYAGCGYGGSCFPKDVKALIKTGKENGCDMKLLTAVEEVNEKQKNVLFNKFSNMMATTDNVGIVAAVWGLAFKPNTDDMREAPSINLIQSLLKAGVKVKVTDPVAMDVSKKIFDTSLVTYCQDKYETAKDVDVIFLVTEWGEFANTDWELIKKNAPNLQMVIDGRNLFKKEDFERLGIKYECIGK